MRKLAAIIWLSAGFAGGMALGAEDIPAAAEAAVSAVSPELEAILADWATHEAQMLSGDFEWRVLQQIRSPTFGALSVAEDVRVGDVKAEAAADPVRCEQFSAGGTFDPNQSVEPGILVLVTPDKCHR